MPAALHPNAPVNRIRTVYCFVHFGENPPKSLPNTTDDLSWKPWIDCKPEEIQNGTISGLAAHQAFRIRGGPALFHSSKSVHCTIYLFDPATHLHRYGRIHSAYSTTYIFHPR